MQSHPRSFFATDPPVRATVGLDRFANTAVLVEIVLTAVKAGSP